MRLGLYSVDEVWKFDSVLDEKYGHVITYQIIIAFLGIELNGKPPHIPRQVSRTTKTGDG